MTTLLERLCEQIDTDGPMTLAEYMNTALLDPDHGYYTSRDPLGEEGDFTTAPEISQIFGELVGLWCAVVWNGMGCPSPVNLVELGPGRGTMMADILRASAAMEGFSDAVRVHMVERSPALKARQVETLEKAGLAHAPEWHETLSDVPDGPILLVANEFFDALPIRQLMRMKNAWLERCVDVVPGNKHLDFVLAPPRRTDDGDVDLPPGLVDVEPGDIVEACPEGQDIAHAIGKRIGASGGAALIIDYGYAESTAGETLQAVKDHKFHEPLVEPGEADLTAHVDFQALAYAAFTGGAQAWGPIPQGQFLTMLGIEARANALMAKANAEQQADIEAGAQRLIDPEQMGALFKVMAVMPRGAMAPPAFE